MGRIFENMIAEILAEKNMLICCKNFAKIYKTVVLDSPNRDNHSEL